MIHLITGYAGYEHIKSADDGAFNAAFFGDGQFIMESGNQFAGSIIDNNTVRILDGDGLMFGRHFRLEPNSHEDVTITTGTAGKNRADLVCVTYKKNEADGTEQTYLEVIKGTEADGTAAVPAYTTGNILEGATFNQMPLYKVNISGVVLSSIEPLFTTQPTYKKLAEQAAQQFEEAVAEKADNLMPKFSGVNPITDTANDTVENWAALGSGLYFFDTNGQVTSKPDDYGWVFNIVSPDMEIRQLWFGRPSERIYHRGGNRSGFHGEWVQLMDAMGGGFNGKVWANYKPPATDWTFKNTCIRNSGGYSVTGNTAVIEFRRK